MVQILGSWKSSMVGKSCSEAVTDKLRNLWNWKESSLERGNKYSRYNLETMHHSPCTGTKKGFLNTSQHFLIHIFHIWVIWCLNDGWETSLKSRIFTKLSNLQNSFLLYHLVIPPTSSFLVSGWTCPPEGSPTPSSSYCAWPLEALPRFSEWSYMSWNVLGFFPNHEKIVLWLCQKICPLTQCQSDELENTWPTLFHVSQWHTSVTLLEMGCNLDWAFLLRWPRI